MVYDSKKKFFLGCGHCKKAKPEFTAAAEVFKDDPKIEFAAIDCTAHSTVCSVYDVKGYPTIKLFQYLNKEPVQDYNGGRTEKDFTSFMATFSTQKIEKKPSPVVSHMWQFIVWSVLNMKKLIKKFFMQKEKRDESNQKPSEVWGHPEGSKQIIHFTENNFDSEIKKHDSILVLFYKCK